jgi:hypothetical protein
MAIGIFAAMLIWAFLLIGAASADPIEPDDMFFPPSSMVTDVYPTQPMTGDGETTPWTAVWTEGDILALDPGRVDVTISGVEILPVLVENPSPSSSEGEYTPADLAAINVANYRDLYLQQPGTDIMDPETDYAADLTTNVLTVEFTAPAVYAVRVETTSRSGPGQPIEQRDYLYSQFVADFFGGEAAGVQRRASLPEKDIYVVSDGDPKDNGFLVNTNSTLTEQGKKVCRATTLKAAIKCMCDESERLGRKVGVVLAGHGNIGLIKVGEQFIGEGLDMTPAEFQKQIDKCVDQIHFFSCNTAQGANGQKFLKDFANSIGAASGWSDTVTAAKSSYFLFIKIRSGYFDVGAGAKKEKKAAEGGGGIAEAIVVGSDSAARASGSSSASDYTAPLAAAAAGVVALLALTGGGWYAARRRRLR